MTNSNVPVSVRYLNCNRVNGVLFPTGGTEEVKITEHVDAEGMRSAAVEFDGGVQGYVTYDINGNKIVSCTTMGYQLTLELQQSLNNIVAAM